MALEITRKYHKIFALTEYGDSMVMAMWSGRRGPGFDMDKDLG